MDLISSLRYMENVVSVQHDVQSMPILYALFRTVAFPYRSAYYFHRLITSQEDLNNQDARALNAVNNPLVISFVGTFMSDLIAKYIGPYMSEGVTDNPTLINPASYWYFTRQEHGEMLTPIGSNWENSLLT